jgi:hypothetical protein
VLTSSPVITGETHRWGTSQDLCVRGGGLVWGAAGESGRPMATTTTGAHPDCGHGDAHDNEEDGR